MVTFDETWHGVLNDIMECGNVVSSRNGQCREVLNYRLVLGNIDTVFLLHPVRKMSPQYAAAEVLWYLSGKDSIEQIKAYAPQYENFAENGVAFGAYGHRWQYTHQEFKTQLHALIANMRRYTNSRQSVVCMWNALDLLHAFRGDKSDLPCTLNWQFMNREGALHMTCTMRSQDAWLGMPYDIFTNAMILRLLATELNLKVGIYTHNVGSLHLYQRNWERAQMVIAQPYVHTWTHGQHWHKFTNGLFDDVEIALAIETWARECGYDRLPVGDLSSLSTPLRDLTLLCVSKWRPVGSTMLSSPLLKATYNAHH